MLPEVGSDGGCGCGLCMYRTYLEALECAKEGVFAVLMPHGEGALRFVAYEPDRETMAYLLDSRMAVRATAITSITRHLAAIPVPEE